jgi:AraC-like DNA-binding protein
MSCSRCKKVVKSELDKNGFPGAMVRDGEVEFSDPLTDDRYDMLKKLFSELELELIDDRNSILIEKIRLAINDLIYNSEEGLKTNFSDFISSKLGYSYHYISTLFSSVHGRSIEKTIISCKIDRVKEILMHEDLTFSETAAKVNYSSVAHLASQFKKETGLTLSQFKALQGKGVGSGTDR